MRVRSLRHVPDQELSAELHRLAKRSRGIDCELLLWLGEFDDRRLYLPAAYHSMYAYCVGELKLSEAAALKRIRVARAARRFPAIFAGLDDGRLNMTSILLLAPHLTPENAAELLAAAENQSKAGVQGLIAARFPSSDVPTEIRPLALEPVQGSDMQLAPEPVSFGAAEHGSKSAPEVAAPPVTPVAPQRFTLQTTIDQETQELLRYAKALLGHAVPSGDMAQVIKRAAGALVEQLEKRRFAKSSRSRPARSTAKAEPEGRHIPAAVRRAVCERDGGRCTFVSDTGRRCESDTRLEFDHIEPVAHGGRSTVANVRLLCRAHNQHAADCTFGAGFMREKRDAASGRARAGDGSRLAAEIEPEASASAAVEPAHEPAPPESVAPWLRALGFRADEARRGDTLCAHMSDASLESRMKFALSRLGRASARRVSPAMG